MKTDTIAEPELYDHYKVEAVLGRGAMGIVYLARDLRIGRLVALKTLQSKHPMFENAQEENAFLQRFHREAELCGSLVHPNIITLYEVGYASRRLTYLAMEYIDGESLLSLLRRNGKLDLRTALKITDDVLQGLAYAHDRGVIHRDIKPANILVTVEGQAKVADFGVARSVRASLTLRTQEGQLLGTPYYMAPEHVAGRNVDSRADLFSVGVVLFEMLSGTRPFEGTAVTDILYNVVNQPAPSLTTANPTAPRWAATFVDRLLQKDPADRFLSASAASRELRRLLAAHDSVDVKPLDMTVTVPVMRSSSPEETPTTPITAPPLRRFASGRIPTAVAFGVITVLIVITVGAIAGITQQIDDRPTVVIPDKTEDEWEQKRVMLREAQILYNAGAYEASLQHFDRYLERYPWSAAAKEGRTQAAQAIEAIRARSQPAVATIDVLEERPKRPRRATRSKAQTASKPAKAEETPPVTPAPPEEKVSIWGRVRRFFRTAIRRPSEDAARPPASSTAAPAH